MSPPVLAFLLGALAKAVRSDLKFHRDAMSLISGYLLLAIGLKGGFALQGVNPAELPLVIVIGLAVGGLIPLLAYAALRSLFKFGQVDSGAIAAHYGSISIITFTFAISTLERQGIPFEGVVYTLAVILEAPGILVGLLLAKRGKAPLGDVAREMLTGKSLILLGGGLAIGAMVGEQGKADLTPFFVEPFQGVLVLFLLDLGMQVVERIEALKGRAASLIAFGICAPLVNGCLGVLAGNAAGLSVGGAFLMGILCASGSYIAATAAVSHSLPEASPSLYLGSSLGVTFPFNILLGIPILLSFAQWVG